MDLKSERLHESTHHARDLIQAVKRRRDPISPVESGSQASYLGTLADIAVRLQREVRWNANIEKFFDNAGEAAMMHHRPLRSPWTL